MEPLTKREEEIMQILWRLKKALVSDLLKEFPPPPPPHSTISSVVRLLEKKGFVGHKAFGRTYEYFPLISRLAYKKFAFNRLIKDYFSGSWEEVVSFMVNEQDISPEERAEILKLIEKEEES